MSTLISLWRECWGWAGLIAALIVIAAVARLIAEDRRLARRRRENAARLGCDLAQVLGSKFRDWDAELDKILRDGEQR